VDSPQSLLAYQFQQVQTTVSQDQANGGVTQSDAQSLQNQFVTQDLNYMAGLAMMQQNMPAYTAAETGLTMAQQVASGQTAGTTAGTSPTAGATTSAAAAGVASNAGITSTTQATASNASTTSSSAASNAGITSSAQALASNAAATISSILASNAGLSTVFSQLAQDFESAMSSAMQNAFQSAMQAFGSFGSQQNAPPSTAPVPNTQAA
jgi:hypothetical protein